MKLAFDLGRRAVSGASIVAIALGVSTAAAALEFETVIVSGEPLPGSDPPAAFRASAGLPNSGSDAFLMIFTDPPTAFTWPGIPTIYQYAHPEGLWNLDRHGRLAKVASRGDEIAPGVTLDAFPPYPAPVVDGARAYFVASTSDGRILLLGSHAGESPTIIAATGDPPPLEASNTDPAFSIGSLGLVSAFGGQPIWTATLASESIALYVSDTFLGSAPGTVRRIATFGGPLPGTSVPLFGYFVDYIGSRLTGFRTRHEIVLHAALADRGDEFQRVVLDRHGHFLDLDFSEHELDGGAAVIEGRHAYAGFARIAPDEETGHERIALVRRARDGTLDVIAVTGDPAPGTALTFGRAVNPFGPAFGFSELLRAPDGALVFSASLYAPATYSPSAAAYGVFHVDERGGVRLVAVSPTTPGAAEVVRPLHPVAAPEGGGVLIDRGSAAASNAVFVDPAGRVTELARSGDSIEIRPGDARTVVNSRVLGLLGQRALVSVSLPYGEQALLLFDLPGHRSKGRRSHEERRH